MVKFLVSAALLASTVAVAAPATAQWAPPSPQGYAYGYNNYGQIRRLEARVQQIRRQIERLDRRNMLSNREARRLSEEARDLDRRINMLARNGFSQRDRYEIETRLARLEQRLYRDVRDGRRYDDRRYDDRDDRRDRDRYYGADRDHDRDRDGRDDRYEDDGGRYPG